MAHVFDPKYVDEEVFLTMDFSPRLPTSPAVTVVSGDITLAVAIGVDAAVGSMMSGPAVVQSSYVQRLCTLGVAGCTYEVTFTAVCSDGETLIAKRYLPVCDRITV